MPITGTNGTVTEDGQEKEAVSVTFTNGAKQQLEELQSFFKTESQMEVVKLAIGFLQRVKEMEEKNKDAK